jgi:hypothetical protein
MLPCWCCCAQAADEELGKKFKDLKETEGIDFKFGG